MVPPQAELSTERTMSGPVIVSLLTALALAGALQTTAVARGEEPSWTGAWAASQQAPEPANALAPADLRDVTLRQVVHLSLGGARLRIRLSNAFGRAPLRMDAVHVARSRGGGAVDPGTDRVVTFAGATTPVLPAGADYWSDPVDLPTAAGADLAVSFHLAAAPEGETSHPGSRATSFLAPGEHAADPAWASARRVEHWFQLSGVDVEARPGAYAVVALGDSITDGHGATTDGDDRWPDDLARRLAAADQPVGVLNAGLGGNRVLADGLGPNALARLDRDVLAQSGVRAVIVLEGINDLGVLTRDAPVSADAHHATVEALLQGYAQIVRLAHAHGLRVIGGTLGPDGGSGYYHPDGRNESDRQAVNAWVRTPGHFDAVVDFDRVLRDPARPDRLRPAFDSGDHLHPSPAGYRAMADAVPLAVLGPR
jgi:lysophospholipase L1-like esterase